jgi:hypothetical protein
MPKLPRARFTKLLIEELSSVDEGAQEKAGSVILKRKLELVPGQVLETAREAEQAAAASFEKKSLLTTPVAGHTHLLLGVDECMSGTTTSGVTADGGDSYGWHSHPWVKDDNGTITIGEAAGHTHEALGATTSVAKRDAKETTMSENTETVELKKRNNLLTAALVAALTLPDDHRTYAATLSSVEAEGFLAKSAADRDVEVKKALESNPVVVELDGVQYRKSAGATTLALVKKAKEQGEALAKRDAELEMERLEKRAVKDLGNLPKTIKAKIALLRAVDAIADEDVRKEAHEMLAGANAAFADVQKNIGHGGKPAPNSARAAWDEGLAAYAKAKNLSPVQATEQFIATTEGEALAEALEAELD